MPRQASLPTYVPPMLAKPSEPFDSPEHIFEIKWDGTRALAYVEAGGYRLMNRRRVDIAERYPEFRFLEKLPPGTILDGEIVVMDGGKPSFASLMGREHLRSNLRIRMASQQLPAIYVVFDQLYQNHVSICNLPLSQRKDILHATVERCNEPSLVYCTGIVGSGKSFFEQAVERDLEGVVAKRLNSFYLPGKRTDAWRKIKRAEQVWCAIIGYIPDPKEGFRSLVLAAEGANGLQAVGKVGSGIDGELRAQLELLFPKYLATESSVTCRERARWLRPGLYCLVSCMERTQRGDLRAPVFLKLRIDK